MANKATIYVFNGKPQIPRILTEAWFKTHPDLVEVKEYSSTRQWVEVILELSRKHPEYEKTHLFTFWHDAANTITDSALSGEVFAAGTWSGRLPK